MRCRAAAFCKTCELQAQSSNGVTSAQYGPSKILLFICVVSVAHFPFFFNARNQGGLFQALRVAPSCSFFTLLLLYFCGVAGYSCDFGVSSKKEKECISLKAKFMSVCQLVDLQVFRLRASRYSSHTTLRKGSSCVCVHL